MSISRNVAQRQAERIVEHFKQLAQRDRSELTRFSTPLLFTPDNGFFPDQGKRWLGRRENYPVVNIRELQFAIDRSDENLSRHLRLNREEPLAFAFLPDEMFDAGADLRDQNVVGERFQLLVPAQFF
jgi:hypothetical protein